MNFLRAITPVITKEIKIKTPEGEQVIKLCWKRPNDDERLELLGQIDLGAEAVGAAKTATEQNAAVKAHVQASRDRIKAYLTGWDFPDGDLAVEFNKNNLDVALSWSEYRQPFDASLMSVLSMRAEEAAAGN